MEILSSVQTFPGRLNLIKTCMTKDLIAVYLNASVTVFRFDGSVVSSVKCSESNVSDFDFEPTGKLIFVAYSDCLSIYNVENGHRMFDLKSHGAQHLKWYNTISVRDCYFSLIIRCIMDWPLQLPTFCFQT